MGVQCARDCGSVTNKGLAVGGMSIDTGSVVIDCCVLWVHTDVWIEDGLLSSLLSSAGFEGCSMVPSIYPLETLHNSLSLKQVNEFLTTVCENAEDSHTRTTRGNAHSTTKH